LKAVLVDRSDPLPLWAQVLADLRAELAAGNFEDRFPTDNELVARYGVSRQTVREAVRRLSDAGLLERGRGRGTRVRAFQQIGGSLESLYEQIERQGATASNIVRTRAVVVDTAAAARLELPADARLVHIERLRLADGEPLALDRAWLPEPLAADLLTTDLTHTGIYAELLRTRGIDVDGASEQIRPLLPEAADRRTLRLPPGHAAFSIERLTTARGRPVEWRHSLVRGDRYIIALSLSRAREAPAALPWAPPTTP
jgi:GntR family transcriptional regulator